MDTEELKTSCCWNKQIKFHLITDYNVDGAVHTQLFLMNKNHRLSEYLIKLVKDDLERNNSPVLDERFREKIALQEMGYKISLSQEELEKAYQFHKDGLDDLHEERAVGFEEEAANLLSNQYANENGEVVEVSTKSSQKQPDEVKVDYSESLKRLEENPNEQRVLDNLLGI